jgi:dTDP-4-amino-4,6-dideoxygalactose transaminase
MSSNLQNRPRFPAVRPELPSINAWRPFAEKAYTANWFTNFGDLSRRLESVLAKRWGFDETVCVAASSGTAAIVAPLLAMGITGPVISPAFTFPATVSAIRMAGCEPVLVDVDARSWRVAPEALERALGSTGARAAIVVCPFGLKSDWSEHIAIARARGALLIIDNAAGLGVARANVEHEPHVFEAYSMHATKPFAIGEGGAVFAHASTEHALRGALNFGAPVYDRPGSPEWGVNGKLGEIYAAIGLAMEQMLDRCLAERRVMAACYHEHLRDHDVRLAEASLDDSCWQMLPVLMPSALSAAQVVKRADARGMEVRRYYRPSLSTLPAFQGSGCPVSESLSERMVCFPVYSNSSAKELSEMSDIADDAVRHALEGA